MQSVAMCIHPWGRCKSVLLYDFFETRLLEAPRFQVVSALRVEESKDHISVRAEVPDITTPKLPRLYCLERMTGKLY